MDEENEGKLFLSLQGCVDAELDYYWSDLLRAADADGNGKVDKSEFVNYCLGDTELTADGDFANASDFCKIKTSIATLGAAGKLVSVVFDLIDTDASGYLDEQEGMMFLRALGTAEDELGYYWADLMRSAC